jgi:uncharacterized membrane protein YdcZ (DUF606 family)
MSGKRWIALRGAVGAVIFYALAAHSALAASRLGEKLSIELTTFGQAVVLAVGGIAGLGAIGDRDFGKLTRIMVVMFVLGGIFFVDGAIKGIITDIWTNIA